MADAAAAAAAAAATLAATDSRAKTVQREVAERKATMVAALSTVNNDYDVDAKLRDVRPA